MEYLNINKRGKIAIKLDEGDELINVISVNNEEDYEILIGTSEGKTVKFPTSKVRSLSRVSRGVKGINVGEGYEVIGSASSQTGDKVFTLSELGFGKLSNIELFRSTNRGAKGSIAQNRKKAGKLIILKTVNGNEDILIITNKGTSIRVSLKTLNTLSRNSKGVTIVNLKKNETISKTTIISNMSEEDDDRSFNEVNNETSENLNQKNLDDGNIEVSKNEIKEESDN